MKPSRPVLLLALLVLGAGAYWWLAVREGEPLGEREFVARASAACETVRSKRGELTPPTSLEGLPEFADRSRHLIGEFRDDLGELVPPRDREADLESLLAVLDQTREALAAAGEAAEQDDEEGVARAFQTVSGERSDKLFRALGVPECVESEPPG